MAYARIFSIGIVVGTADTISHRSFILLAVSARRRRIIDLDRFLIGGPPAERRGGRVGVTPEKIKGIEVWCR